MESGSWNESITLKLLSLTKPKIIKAIIKILILMIRLMKVNGCEIPNIGYTVFIMKLVKIKNDKLIPVE